MMSNMLHIAIKKKDLQIVKYLVEEVKISLGIMFRLY